MSRTPKWLPLLALLAVVAIVFAACAGAASPSPSSPTATGGASPTTATSAAPFEGAQYPEDGSSACDVADYVGIMGSIKALDQYTVDRSATAKWGALGSGTAIFPLTIGTCAFTISFDVKVTLHSHAVPGCPNPSGQFGFVENGCTTRTITADQTIPGTTGNNLVGTGCTEAALNALVGTDVLIPVWDSAGGTGSNATYHIKAFAIFHLTGWSTNGNNAGGTLNKQCDASADGGVDEADNTPCIRGIFKGLTTQTGTVVPGLSCRDNILACFVYLDE